MQWIEGFKRSNGASHLIVVGPTGERTLSTFKQLRSVAPERRGARSVALSEVALDGFKECDPREYLKLVGFEVPVSSCHRVYELSTPTARLLVPGAVMLLGLFTRIWHIAPWLTSAATLDMLAVPTFDDGKHVVTFFPGSLSGGRDSASTQERFLWLTNFPSARRAWSSVAVNACAGRIACDMPKAFIDGSARGLSRGDTVLVTRLHVNVVKPTEQPLASAFAIAGRSFRVSPRTEHVSAMRPDTLSDATLPSHSHGWHLTDEEWAEVSTLLDVRSTATARVRIDEILLKLGTGYSWDDISFKGDARVFYLRLRRQGRWKQICDIVKRRASLLDAPLARPANRPQGACVTAKHG